MKYAAVAGAFFLVYWFAVSRSPRPRPASAKSEDVFQQAVKLYTSGDQAGAYQLFVQSANAGNPKAATQAGWQHEMGKGVPQSDAEAATWYRKGAEMGDARGQKNIGSMYESGRGVPEDWVEAAKWYRQSAENGDRDGQAALARAYQFGIGVPQNRWDAIEWDKKAAAQGDEEAAYFAHWLADRTNNIGFRNEAERNTVIGFKMVDMIVQNEPAGRIFHDSRERNGYIAGVARRLDSDMGYAHWWTAKADYDRCQWQKKGGCRDPGAEPR
jgi:TPR repeat protein